MPVWDIDGVIYACSLRGYMSFILVSFARQVNF